MSEDLPDYAAFSSDYYHTSGRAAQVRRVHIKAPAVAFKRSAPRTAFCGIGAYDVTNSPKITHAPNKPLPPGLGWCPKCLGVAAEHLGVMDSVAAVVTPALIGRIS